MIIIVWLRAILLMLSVHSPSLPLSPLIILTSMSTLLGCSIRWRQVQGKGALVGCEMMEVAREHVGLQWLVTIPEMIVTATSLV